MGDFPVIGGVGTMKINGDSYPFKVLAIRNYKSGPLKGQPKETDIDLSFETRTITRNKRPRWGIKGKDWKHYFFTFGVAEDIRDPNF